MTKERDEEVTRACETAGCEWKHGSARDKENVYLLFRDGKPLGMLRHFSRYPKKRWEGMRVDIEDSTSRYETAQAAVFAIAGRSSHFRLSVHLHFDGTENWTPDDLQDLLSRSLASLAPAAHWHAKTEKGVDLVKASVECRGEVAQYTQLEGVVNDKADKAGG